MDIPRTRIEQVDERTARIPFQVTPAEKAKFMRLAKKRHMTISELIRQVLHKEADSASREGQAA